MNIKFCFRFQQRVLQVVAYFVFDLKNKRKIKEGTIWNKEKCSTYFDILLKLDHNEVVWKYFQINEPSA